MTLYHSSRCIRHVPTLNLPSSLQPRRSLFGLFGHQREKRISLIDSNAIAVREPEHPVSLTGRPRLTELSLKGIARYMNTAQCQNILVLSGHGISAAAGIPNYRKYGGREARKLMGDKGWDEKFDAEKLFDKIHFTLLPYGMLRFVQAMWPGNHRPTFAHYFIRLVPTEEYWSEHCDVGFP